MSAKLKSFVSRPTLTYAVAALSCLAFAERSNATTVNSNFTVQVTVNSTCIINSASTLDFGPVGVLTANADASSTLYVQCTNTTPYDIGLNAGTGSGASVATRKMTNGSATVNYSLYTDSARTVVWGNTTRMPYTRPATVHSSCTPCMAACRRKRPRLPESIPTPSPSPSRIDRIRRRMRSRRWDS
jgi:spore coat protein U-like protein